MKLVLGCISAPLAVLALVLWYFLLYQILVRVDVPTSVWVCYWTYVPVSFIASILSKVGEHLKED